MEQIKVADDSRAGLDRRSFWQPIRIQSELAGNEFLGRHLGVFALLQAPDPPP